MEIQVLQSRIGGTVAIPGSKSHTIRALLIAACASGKSTIYNPLFSSDTEACINVCGTFGARINRAEDSLTVHGTGGRLQSSEPEINVGNSGTTLYLSAGIACIGSTRYVFTGDEQIRKRPIGQLLQALRDLGAETESIRNNDTAPIAVHGPLSGGETSIECPTSQFLSSLLLSAPLATGESIINVPLLYERPYVAMTLWWLDSQGIQYRKTDDYSWFSVPGRQIFNPFTTVIPGDFSSATFFLCAAAITGSTLTLKNLNMSDPQGDKEVIEILKNMGCSVYADEHDLTIEGKKLRGIDIDLNAMPDALPALAVTGCFAEGVTRLYNVPQARLKETDRISVMREELEKMGAHIEETTDGLIIHKSTLRGTRVNGHHDHRVVMALAIAGLAAEGETVIETAEAASVTFPEFFSLLSGIRIK
jgi:3-phosphoshikimate 1-carboxyvinyltransferase